MSNTPDKSILVCDMCGRADFKRMCGLTNHRRVCTGIRDRRMLRNLTSPLFKCDKCDRVLSTKHGKTLHMRKCKYTYTEHALASVPQIQNIVCVRITVESNNDYAPSDAIDYQPDSSAYMTKLLGRR